MNDITLLEEILEDTCPQLKLCSCGSCGNPLVSERERKAFPHSSRGLYPVYVRLRSVPFCRSCWSTGDTRHVLEARRRARP